jgi:hypothetical protein
MLKEFDKEKARKDFVVINPKYAAFHEEINWRKIKRNDIEARKVYHMLNKKVLKRKQREKRLAAIFERRMKKRNIQLENIKNRRLAIMELYEQVGSLRTAAKAVGVTPERIRQIIKKEERYKVLNLKKPLLTKNCKKCGKEFKAKSEERIFCSRSCHNAGRRKFPSRKDYLEYAKGRRKWLWKNDPEFRALHQKRCDDWRKRNVYKGSPAWIKQKEYRKKWGIKKKANT